ncbi:MAG: hypothetical protein JRL30_27640 [Deltaproteobacteria bacterium]|nr:hypothetical protein [Deltaproteobacteria bacterium]
MSIKDSIKNFFTGATKPGVEYYPLKQNAIDEDFKKYVFERYREACQSIDEKLPVWNANRSAYYGETFARFRNWSKVRTKAGFDMSYTSDSVADKVNDLIAIQTSGGIRIYALPNISEESPIFLNFIAQTDIEVSAALAYFRKIWEKCLQDLQERQLMNMKDIMVLLDAYLCERGITKQVQEFDWKTGQYDVSIKTIKPEHFLDDPSATHWADGEFIFEKIYMRPYAAANLYPDHKEQIYKAVIGTKNTGKAIFSTDAQQEHDNQRNRVLVVQGYFKDDTMEIKEVPDSYVSIGDSHLPYTPHSRQVGIGSGRTWLGRLQLSR